MAASDRCFISNSFIISEISGGNGICSIECSMIPDSRVYDFTNGYNQSNKSAVSLEQFYVPIASQSGVLFGVMGSGLTASGGTNIDGGNLPFLNQAAASDISQASLFTRFKYGLIPTVGNSGNVNPPSGISSQPVIQRSVGFSLPMFGAGFGYDVKGNQVPTSTAPGSTVLQDVNSWKAGPIDLRWDDTRQVWCGSDFFRNDIVVGYLSSDIGPAVRMGPTNFQIISLVSSGGVFSSGQTYSVLNFDCNLTVSLNSKCAQVGATCIATQADIFVAALRIAPNLLVQIYVGF